MTHLQELAHTVFEHRFFQVPKEKKYRVRSRAMHWPHYGFSLSVYRALKLALLRNHANASLYLHNCSGILDRNEARDLLIEWSGSREKILLTFWCWLRVCIWTCWKTNTWGSRMMHLFQALGTWVIPAEKLNQNTINQSRKSPTGREGEVKGRNVGILFMQKEREKKTSIYEILCEVRWSEIFFLCLGKLTESSDSILPFSLHLLTFQCLFGRKHNLIKRSCLSDDSFVGHCAVFWFRWLPLAVYL